MMHLFLEESHVLKDSILPDLLLLSPAELWVLFELLSRVCMIAIRFISLVLD
jgi:hypothetical protein